MIKVLLAHPDKKILGIYQNNLKDCFDFDSVYDGLSAVRKFKQFKPDCVVSDYDLPLLSGITFLKFIRNSEDNDTPFLFLTNHLDNSEALGLSANDWIDQSSSSPEFLIKKIYYHLKTT
jgi:DNA-binding response OmpR family regulator